MATTIQLEVQVNKAQATADIQAVEQAANAIAKNPHVINFTVNGADVVVKEAKSATTALLEAAAAEQRRAKAEVEAEASRTRAKASEIRETNRLAVEQEKSAQTANRLAIEQEKTARATQNAGSAATGASSAFSALSVALGNIAARAFHLVISKITQGIREAVTEMKDVDTQLTNISKVSGITGKALADMGERAYETASKYGVAADEFLSAVYTFQKAGLGESAEAMGELAVKTMLVGDTTADVASKFLISANAAWQMGGDMERLNQIVDEADYINNNYATDLGKLSEGLPRVAAVAAQAGMSAEETLAAIGTITAVTQESGTKSATALRALILNIEGQIGEFVDETGETFTVTEESVKSMQGLMEKYAKAELDAARASGELINPMTAIKALFEGMANADLNDQELFTLLSGMGGKLRTNQLTALVQNFKLFEEMMEGFGEAAGTADAEVGKMLEGWNAKTNILKNTWTKFVADIVSTDLIKGGIDTLTGFIDKLDEGIKRFKDSFYDSKQTQSVIDGLKEEYDALIGKAGELDETEQARVKTLESQIRLLELQQQLEEEQAAKKLQNQLTSGSRDSHTANLFDRAYGGVQFTGDMQAYQKELAGVIAKYQDYYDKVKQVEKAGGELTESQKHFVSEFDKVSAAATAQGAHVDGLVDGWYNIVDAQGNFLMRVKDMAPEIEHQADVMQGMVEASDQTISAEEQSMARLRGDSESLKNSTENTVTPAEALERAISSISFAQSIVGAEALTRALEAASAAAAGIAVPAIIGGGGGGGGGTPTGGGRAVGTKNAPGGPTLVNELGPELISENGKAYIANGGRPGIVNLSKGAIVLTAKETKEALRGGSATTVINAAAGGRSGGSTVEEAQAGRQRAIDEAQKKNQPWKCPYCGTQNYGGQNKCSNCGASKPSTATGKSKKKGKSKKEKAQDAADKLKEKLANLDKQAELALNKKQYDKAISIYKQCISLIKKQINVYKKAGYKEKSNEVLDLRNMIFDYQAKIESAQKAKESDQQDALAGDTSERLSNLDAQAELAESENRFDDQEAIYNQALALLDQQIEAYRAAGYDENSDEILALKNKRKDYEKKLDSVAKARADALKEQIVGDSDNRLSNLDAQAVLADAEKRYEDEKKAYEDAIKIIDQQIAAYKAAGYDENSDEVLALRKKRNEYEDKLVDVTKAIIEGESGAVLSNLSSQASLARAEKRYEDEKKLYDEAIAIIQQQIDAYRNAGYSDTSDEILALRSSLLDYQDKRKSVEQSQWDELLTALQSDIDAQNQAETLAERQKALEEAQKALENLDNQRTVRVYNAATGQWEWVSDAKSRESAQSGLESAQKSYDDFIRSKAISDIQRAKEEGLAFDMGNLGPQVTSDVLSRLNSPEVQEYAKMLDAIYGGATFRELTGVLSGNSSATDSHDTVYNFGNITLSEAQAQSMSVADLARKLNVLKIS